MPCAFSQETFSHSVDIFENYSFAKDSMTSFKWMFILYPSIKAGDITLNHSCGKEALELG